MAAADLLDEMADDDPSPFLAEYGAGQALNTGNLMLVMSQQIMQQAAQKPGGVYASRALDALQDMLVHAAVGQHLDILYGHLPPSEVTLEMSVRMTELKAGTLVSGACRMGALMSGAGDEVVDLIARFGSQSGSISQLLNDLYDVIPRQQAGKDGPGEEGAATSALPPPKTDFLKRKRTLPIVFTLRDDSPAENPVQKAYGDSRAAIDEEELRRTVLETGGVQFANLIIDVHRQNAKEALDELEILRPGARAILAPLLPGADLAAS